MIFNLLKPPPLAPRLQRLRNSTLFDSLSALELKILGDLLHERRYLCDEIVFDQGEEGQALYVVTSGRVVISRAHGSVFKVIAELGPGSVFGDMALLDNSPRVNRRRFGATCFRRNGAT